MRWRPIAPEWQHLYAALPKAWRHRGLSDFLRWLTARAIPPTTVAQADYDAYRDDLLAAAVCSRHRARPGAVLRLWNQAVEQVPGWPAVRLRRHIWRKPKRHRDLSAFPFSFQEEVAAYAAWYAAQMAAPRGGPAAPYRPRSVALRLEVLRVSASMLVDAGAPIAAVASLAGLVGQAERIIEAWLARTGHPTNFVRDVATTLLAVGRDYLHLDGCELTGLIATRRRLGSRDTSLGRTNRRAAALAADPQFVGALLELPTRLAAEAEALLAAEPALAVRRMQAAVLIEILLLVPVRNHWLADARLDRNVLLEGADWQLAFPEHESRSGYRLRYALPPSTQALLGAYLASYRSLSAPPASPWLFVDAEGQRAGPHKVYGMVNAATRRLLGAALSAESFRAVAMALATQDSPHALPMLQKLVGHRRLDSTQRFVKAMPRPDAARQFDALLHRSS